MTINFGIEHEGYEFDTELVTKWIRKPRFKYGKSEGKTHIVRVLEIWAFFFYLDITLITKKKESGE